MCRAAKRLDRSCKTTAQDVSKEVANECGWVDQYLVCRISDAQLDLLAPFDVISLTHVIEHLPDPVAGYTALQIPFSEKWNDFHYRSASSRGMAIGKKAPFLNGSNTPTTTCRHTFNIFPGEACRSSLRGLVAICLTGKIGTKTAKPLKHGSGELKTSLG